MSTETETGRRWPRAAAVVLTGAVLAATAACGAGGDQAATPPEIHPPAAEALTQTDVDAWLDGLLPASLEAYGIAGATVSVVDDGEIVTARGYGLADTETGAEVDAEQTLFRVGSVSKLVTATAVMQLVESGELDLDTDVDAYLDFEVPREFDRDLTLRHLLTHTAGFEERIAGLIGSGDGETDLRQALVEDPPKQIYEPGTTPAYSNYGNALAGYIVEIVSGVEFEEYVEREILEPIGMDSSTFRQPLPGGLADRVSNGYEDASGEARPFEVVGTPPAGSLSAPATDMARFMLAHLDALPEDQSVLGTETLELMHAAALGEDTLGGLAEAPGMTLGFFEEDRNGHRIVGHGGDTNYFHSHLQVYPEDGAGIFLSLNSSGTTPTATLDLRRAVLNGFADRYFPGQAPEGGAVDGDDAELIAGTYVSSRGFQSTFMSVFDLFAQTTITALDDGRLLLEPGPGSATPAVYEQVGPSLWRDVDGQGTIAVRVEDGEVTGIVHDSAFTLLPLAAERAVGLPILIGATVILLIGLIAWPIAAIVRRRRGVQVDAEGRGARALTRAAMGATVLAVVGWAVIVMSAMGLQDVPAAMIRAAQALQLIGAAGIVPAAVGLVGGLRRKAGWRAATANALVLLSLSAVLSFAIEFQLLSFDISY